MPVTGLADDLAPIAAGVRASGDELAEACLRQVRAQVPEAAAAGDVELGRALHRSLEANLTDALARLGGGRTMPLELPPDTARLVALTHRRVPLRALLQAQALAHAVLWEGVSDAVEGAGLPSPARRAAARSASEHLFAYNLRLTELTERRYEQERVSSSRCAGAIALDAVREILLGSAAAAPDVGYDLAMRHVAFVAWGREPERAATAAAAGIDRRVLVVRPDDDTVWGWLGGYRDFDRRERARLGQARPPRGSAIAFGLARRGIDGFRRSHEAARKAQQVALCSGQSLVAYRDVALEALSGLDEEDARRFVTEELGDLAAPGRRSGVLRDTLRAYFAASGNAAASSAALGVHVRTIAYRLRKMEDALGYPVNRRRTELDVALRLHAMLSAGGAPAAAAPPRRAAALTPS